MGKAYRCPGCKSTIEETSGEVLVCSFCGRQYKNPNYRPRELSSLPISVSNPVESGSRGGFYSSDSYRGDYNIGYDGSSVSDGYRSSSYSENPSSGGYDCSSRIVSGDDPRVYRGTSSREDYRTESSRKYGDSADVGSYDTRGYDRSGRDYGVDSESGYGSSGYLGKRSEPDNPIDKRVYDTRSDVATIKIMGDAKARSCATERISTGSFKDGSLSVDEISEKMKSTLKEMQDLVKEMERLSQLLERKKF